ncbi:MAG TPA: dihydrofolate reductase family protein [Acidimicrobiales bacterium]|nr:dihydrofolate reductase family protein [Acidimicrobiales bacterium]
MAKLIYSTIVSLDGFIEDEQGRFDWATPDDEVFEFANELERSARTHLYGRRMYETMVFWETASDPDDSPLFNDYVNTWRAAEKVVYSRTLQSVSSERTRIEREFEAEAVRELKESSPTDVVIGGAQLAGHAIAQGLVDECNLLVVPALVGGGKRALPPGVRRELTLVDERRFAGGFVHLRYRL